LPAALPKVRRRTGDSRAVAVDPQISQIIKIVSSIVCENLCNLAVKARFRRTPVQRVTAHPWGRFSNLPALRETRAPTGSTHWQVGKPAPRPRVTNAIEKLL